MFRVILERFWITPLPPAEALSAAERGRIPDPSLFRVIQSAAKNPGPFLRLSTQVPPRRVFRFDECNLSRPRLPLDLFLGGDCRGDVVGLLKIDETVDPIALCESRHRASFVFIHTAFEVIGYTGVERSRRAAHYIDEVALAARWFPHTATGSGILRCADSALNDTKKGDGEESRTEHSRLCAPSPDPGFFAAQTPL